MRPGFRAHSSFAILALGAWMICSWPTPSYAQVGIVASPGNAPVSQGELEFRLYCSQCHGMEATGNGPVARALRTKPANLRMLTKKNGGVFPEQEIRDFIDGTKEMAVHGAREMPIWGLAFQYRGGPVGEIHGPPPASKDEVDSRINNLVDYIKSIQSK
jgi:mono/diheme cytochrome c family protein